MYISSSYLMYRPILHHKSRRKSCKLHVQSRSAAIFVLEDITIKMSKRKKTSTKEEILPNSEYAYSDIVDNFTEHDRLLESDVKRLNCFTEYQVERSLNSFKDQEINDHLYRIFSSKKNRKHYFDEEDHIFCKTISNPNFT